MHLLVVGDDDPLGGYVEVRSECGTISVPCRRGDDDIDVGQRQRGVVQAVVCRLRCGGGQPLVQHRRLPESQHISAVGSASGRFGCAGQPGAKKALAEIWNAEDKAHALTAVKAFENDYRAKIANAVAKITDDLNALLAFYDDPAEHWIHLRTTNPIETTFATVRNRSKITKGPGSRAAGLAMAFKLIEAAQSRWRAVNAPHLVALVHAGAQFENGKLIERPDNTTEEEAA